jgi:hypothetical protein
MSHDGFLAPKAFKLSGIEFYRLWAYLMMSVPEPTILDVYGVFFVYFQRNDAPANNHIFATKY